jgi:hypothetical protein
LRKQQPMYNFVNDWWPLLVFMPIIGTAFAVVAKKLVIERYLRRGRRTKATLLFSLCALAFAFGAMVLRLYLYGK